jgi:PPOX class probable F420-dependent enzyme
MNSPLDQFRNQRYISLESYRRDGTPVRTPVWFAEKNGRLYFYSMAESGKAKRLRRNPRVALASCDGRGRRIYGEFVKGTARILPPEEAKPAHDLLVKKYGWQRRLLDFFWLLGGRKPRIAGEIRLDT